MRPCGKRTERCFRSEEDKDKICESCHTWDGVGGYDWAFFRGLGGNDYPTEIKYVDRDAANNCKIVYVEKDHPAAVKVEVNLRHVWWRV